MEAALWEQRYAESQLAEAREWFEHQTYEFKTRVEKELFKGQTLRSWSDGMKLEAYDAYHREEISEMKNKGRTTQGRHSMEKRHDELQGLPYAHHAPNP